MALKQGAHIGNIGRWLVDTQRLGEQKTIAFDVYAVPIDTIVDGVGLYIPGTGWWSVSFEDFEQMYELAKAARENDVGWLEELTPAKLLFYGIAICYWGLLLVGVLYSCSRLVGWE